MWILPLRPVADRVVLHDNRDNVRGGGAAALSAKPPFDLRAAQAALPLTPPRVAAADAPGV